MTRSFTVRELAAEVGGVAAGDLERLISGVNSPRSAASHDVVFIESAKHVDELAGSAAGAALVPRGVEPPGQMSAIAVDDPALAMIHIVDLLVPHRRPFADVSPLAFVARDARIGPHVGIGPFAYIGDGVQIGRGSEIYPGTTIGAGTMIGEDCIIYAGVHIYHDVTIGNRVVLHSGTVIGADGFGFLTPGRSNGRKTVSDVAPHCKVRQLGRVVLEDDVEVGANSAIDRATFDVTRVGCGTKIDNLVTVGHNCAIGRHCIVVGQVGISGSTRIGDNVVIAGQAGLTGHLTIGDGAVIGAQSGVTKSVGAGEVVLGSPAVEARRAKRALALVDSLPEFKKALADHARRLAGLERRME